MALLGLASVAMLAFPGIAGISAASKSPPVPTQKEIQGCVKAVTAEKPLTSQQVAGCKAAVLQTYLPEKCAKGPSGYLIDLMGGYRGIHGKAAHEWALRVGRRPFLVRSDRTTQGVLSANIC